MFYTGLGRFKAFKPVCYDGSNAGVNLKAPTGYWNATQQSPTLIDGGISSQSDSAADGRENRLTYSNTLSNAAWSKGSGINTTATFIANPINGSLDMMRIEDVGASSTEHRFNQTITVTAGQTLKLRLHAQPDQRTWVFLRVFDGTTTKGAWYNLSGSGALGTVESGATASITQVGSSYLCYLEWTAGASGTGNVLFSQVLGNNGSQLYTSVAGEGLYIYNPEFAIDSATFGNLVTTTTPIFASGYPATQGTAANRPILSGASNEENLQLGSSTLTSGTYWTSGQCTISASVEPPPFGSETVVTITEDATAGVAHGMSSAGAIAYIVGQQHRVVRYVKNGTRRYATLSLNEVSSASNWFGCKFDLQLGTKTAGTQSGNATLVDTAITDVGSGWYKIEILGSFSSGTGLNPYLNLSDDAVAVSAGGNRGRDVYNGDGASFIYAVYPYQQRSTATNSYIPTTTFPIYAGINGNRVPVFDGSNDSLTTSLAVNPTGGMWGIAVVRPNLLHTGSIYSSQRGTANDRLQFFLLNTGAVYVRVKSASAVYIGRIAPSAYSANQTAVFSWTYDGGTAASGIKIYKNGVQIDTTNDNSGVYAVPTAGATMEIGSQNNSIDTFFNGYVLPAAFGQGGQISDAERIAWENHLMDRFGI